MRWLFLFLGVLIVVGRLMASSDSLAVTQPLVVPGQKNKQRDIALLLAIAAVEGSRGILDTPGRDGELGILQIRPIFVRDVNRILKYEKYTLDDRLDPIKSAEMFWVIADHYNPDGNRERIARRFNGGTNGYLKRSTACYWGRVRNLLMLVEATTTSNSRGQGSGILSSF